jgi:capsular exopolysaccharide synthesis family protein
MRHVMTPRPLPALRPDTAPTLVERLPAPVPPRRSETAFADDEHGPDWRRISSALLRFKWLVLAAIVAGLAAGFGATRMLRPVYRAQANVWIDVPNRSGGDRSADNRGPIRTAALLEADDWVELLRSYIVLDQVVRDLRLYLGVKRPAERAMFSTFNVTDQFRPGVYQLQASADGRSYTLSNNEGMALEHGAVGDSVGRRLGFLWQPATLPRDHAIEFSLTAPRDAASGLGNDLDVHMDLNGNFLAVELRGQNPAVIARILNAVTQRYVDVAAQLKREKLTELTKLLEDQLNTAHRNLDDAETALQRFRTRTITLPSEQTPGRSGGAEAQDPVRSNFFDMEAEQDQLRRDRQAIEGLLPAGGAGDGALPVDALSAIGSVQHAPELANALKELSDKRAELRAYRYHYSDAYPPLQRLAGQVAQLERQTIPTLARGLAAQLAARESELGRQVNTSSLDLRAIPARTIEEVRLRRNADLKEQTYTALQQRFDEARLAAEATVPDVRVLDPAVVPQRPVKNTAPRLLLLGLIGGLALGMVGAVVMDRVDSKVRYPEQVSHDLGLPILGVLPHLRTKEPGEVVEALRGLRLNVIHEYGSAAAQPLVFTVTSPGPGDGKTFLSSNLALAFAEGGHRTLLVDADIRRGLLHRRLKANRQPGLADYLLGQTTADEIVQQTAYPRLSLIGCGTRTQRAPELLDSPPMADLLARVRGEYDVVLIDSPPLTAGVDPYVLGTLTGSVIVVLRTGHSNRNITGAKLEMLHRLPIRLLGAVLNDVPRGGAYGYYAYYSYYLPGYEAVDEQGGRLSGPVVVTE